MTTQLEISTFISPLIKLYRSASDELDNYFELGLADYIQSQTEKYYFTNTFLHRNERVRFTDIYYPVNSTYKLLTTDFSDLNSIFSEYKNITIVGSAGSGKTTLLKHIFLKCVQSCDKIPILIELRNLNEYDGNFEKLIVEKVLKSKVKPTDQIFRRTLESGKFLFLLDGYDEIFSNKKQDINRQIELFVDSYSNNSFLITTRPGSGIENFSRFYDFSVNHLTDIQVVGFISMLVSATERRNRIISLIKNKKNVDYKEYLRNPLLLSMFIMTFENHPEIPKSKSAFYRNVFDTLYSRHDGWTKNSFPREKFTKLQQGDFENILCIFSYLTLIEGKYTFTYEYLLSIFARIGQNVDCSFDAEDLVKDFRTSISILVLDGFEFYFPHRSMQEYFTALFISKLPTNKKKVAYNNLSKSLASSGTDNNSNLWKLCLELDEVTFKSSFLIPSLKDVLSQLKSKTDRALIDQYLEIGSPNLYVSKSGKSSKVEILTSISFIDSLLEFCEITYMMDLYLFIDRKGFRSEIERLYFELQTRENRKGSFPLLGKDDIINLLIENNLEELVHKLISDLNITIKRYLQEVSKKKSNLDDLLRG